MNELARYPIVVGVDLSEYSDSVLDHAFDQALRHERPTLHVVRVVPHAGAADERQQLLELVVRCIEDAVPADRRADWSLLVHQRIGRVEEEIAELAAEAAARLIVVGRFGHSARHGSSADAIVRAADCPVLVVTPPRETDAADRQCPACVALRHDSDGEQWYCPDHHSDEVRLVFSRFGPSSVDPIGRSGTMW
jgi:nucleotide-binding universal stress UspA family protein